MVITEISFVFLLRGSPTSLFNNFCHDPICFFLSSLIKHRATDKTKCNTDLVVYGFELQRDLSLHNYGW